MSTNDTSGTPNSSAAASGAKPSSSVGAPAPRKASIWDVYYPRRVDGHQDVIHVASFPEIIWFWPTMAICFLGALFQGTGLINPVAVGWVTIIILSFNFLVLVQDFDQKQFVILVLITVAAALGIWIVNLYGFAFFTSVANWIASFQPSFGTDAYILMGTVLLVLIVWGGIAPIFDYWKLEQNEFVHYTQPIGRDMSIARLGCTVYKEIPDIFECILTFGGGTLIIKRENQVLATIRNVPFLGRRMQAIEHLLSETRVTVSHETNV